MSNTINDIAFDHCLKFLLCNIAVRLLFCQPEAGALQDGYALSWCRECFCCDGLFRIWGESHLFLSGTAFADNQFR